MSYKPKENWRDPTTQLLRRRAEILAEYRFYNLEPVRIGGEPISMELALYLGLIVDTREVASG